ncbi:CCA tRNA nucleotidyltransferase [Paenibacillus piri]|uniref:CCA tRNA nucleotidyltransferase n=1 Tax=Paenibacillus piri TaxID=2547395 RepID=A0A4R5KWH1_9BACL|nr:CCA tRNA nucleotidyltransferase [Paenibacillus piri]TDF99377.1 CCA tRNA nucleotidyltransferase [Paenibacillus piri]
MTMQLERGAKKVIQRLLENGYEAYMVGGCVRDRQLNRTVKDYDIATSAKPDQVQRLFRRTIPTGLQHGTITVKVDDCLYEVTTFRLESGYADFRRPAEVQYIDSLYEDLRRRDFTMNAMALDLEGRLIDPFHGMDDVASRLLRCVGDASERFREDALRMLRCIRFAAEYDLDIERQTWHSLLVEAPLLAHIAMERVRMELERMLTGANPKRAVELLIESGLMANAKQPLLLAALEPGKLSPAWGNLDSVTTKLAYLYWHAGAGAAEAESELRKLTFSKQQLEQVRQVLAAAAGLSRQLAEAEAGTEASGESGEARLERAWKLTAVAFGAAAVEAVRNIAAADPAAWTKLGVSIDMSGSLAENGNRWLRDMPVQRLDELRINGKDLIALMNRPAGAWISQVMGHLLRETALNRLENEKEALLAEAGRYEAGVLRQESGPI